MFDTSTELGTRALRRLRDDQVIWLVTVDPDGTPQPSPIWFLWDAETILFFSQPNKPKLRNIRRNPRVALHFDSDGEGGDIVVLTGTAEVLSEEPPDEQMTAYLAKYRAGIEELGMTPAGMAQEYSVRVRVRPTRLRGF